MASEGRRRADTPKSRHSGQVDPIAPARRGSNTEQTVARLHTSARRLVLPGLVSIGAAGAGVYGIGTADVSWHRVAIAAVAVVVVLLIGVLPFLLWASRVYLITTRRIVATRGLFSRERRELLHSRANLLELQRRPLQKAFGSGDIVIRQGEREVMRLLDVPGAVLTETALRDLMEHAGGSTMARTRQPESTRRAFDPPAR